MKGVIIINSVLLTILISMLVGCSGEGVNVKTNNTERIRIAIYPSSGGLSDTYYFVINSQNELLTETGTRICDDLSSNPFINKDGIYSFQSESKQLTTEEANYIIDLAARVFEDDEDNVDKKDDVVLDGWNVSVLYCGKSIVHDYDDIDCPHIMDLVDECIELSPIEVDLHGWA